MAPDTNGEWLYQVVWEGGFGGFHATDLTKTKAPTLKLNDGVKITESGVAGDGKIGQITHMAPDTNGEWLYQVVWEGGFGGFHATDLTKIKAPTLKLNDWVNIAESGMAGDGKIGQITHMAPDTNGEWLYQVVWEGGFGGFHATDLTKTKAPTLKLNDWVKITESGMAGDGEIGQITQMTHDTNGELLYEVVWGEGGFGGFHATDLTKTKAPSGGVRRLSPAHAGPAILV